MPQKLQLLIAEDNAADAELVVRALRQGGYEPEWERVDNARDYTARLRAGLDLVISDYEMPQFGGLRALELLQASGLDVPFIIVSGTIGEETAVGAMKLGASDYLLKDRLGRLALAVAQILARHKLRAESRAAQEAIARAEAKYRSIFDHSVEGLYQTTPDGRLLIANPALARIAGYASPEEMIADVKDIAAQFYLNAEDRAQFQRIIGAEGQVRGFEMQMRSRDGSNLWVSADARIIRNDRGEVCYEGALRDITERKAAEAALRASEARFRQVVENIHEVFWMTDAEKHRMLYVSPGYETVWGRSCESLYAEPGRWLETVHPEDRERVRHATFTKQVRGDFDETYRIIRPDGSVRWIRDRAFPVREKSGEVRRIVGTAQDVTDYRMLEEQFRQAQKMEAIGTLAGGIAHDFNNILTAIVGYAELARMSDDSNPEVQEHLGSVLQASRRATDLVRQILAFSRQHAQERFPIRLQPVMAESFKLLRATIPSTIEFDVSIAGDAPVVLGDATQVHQVLVNLGTNAWHAMQDRAGRIQVKLDRWVNDASTVGGPPGLKPGVYARVGVSDTGCGMEAATVARIFEPFFTTKPLGVGTGLGLAVVHGIMANHDGAVTVRSEPGAGTLFELFFPAYAGDAPDDAGEAAPVPRGGGELLLFVDDEDLLVRLGAQILRTLGYAVETATQPDAALELVKRDPARFAAVLTDQTMPGMTGLMLANQLQRIRPGLPVILMTGYGTSLTAEQKAAAGIRRVMLKPTTFQSLGRSVSEVFAEGV